MGESFPVDGDDHVVGPSEALVHIGFEKAKPVLAADGGSKFSSDVGAADDELVDGCREKGHMDARGRVVLQLVGGKDVSIAVELGRQGGILVRLVVVLVAFDMADCR